MLSSVAKKVDGVIFSVRGARAGKLVYSGYSPLGFCESEDIMPISDPWKNRFGSAEFPLGQRSCAV